MDELAHARTGLTGLILSSARKIGRLAADASPEAVSVWCHFMESHLASEQVTSRLSPETLRQLWDNSLAQSERYSVFLTTTWNETGFVDSGVVLKRFWATFANGSKPRRCQTSDQNCWSAPRSVLEAGLSVRDEALRLYLAYRFLQCLPADWDLSATRYDNAPTLQSLIDAAQQHATTTNWLHGPSALGRPDPVILQNHAYASRAAVASAPLVSAVPAPAPSSGAPISGSQAQYSPMSRKRKSVDGFSSISKRQFSGSGIASTWELLL
ncbi:hypothetical protein BGZ65_009079 [Modicella reniformis]|uniref:Uncharacterized protein n=1 Tax=Modicella reniformis TaxID=1440133 RepID=A0A9P6LWV6_9FUNG|nr:hypothetical protein BGZ65_009079 [Modicella reniformis]